MPLFEDMSEGYGHSAFKDYPLWPQAFKMEKVRAYEDGAEFFVFNIFCAQGTRMILPSYQAQYKDDPRRLHNVDLNKLVLRDAVIIDIPKEADGIVEVDELEAAFNTAPVQRGDALLLRTGWGDDERYFKIGHDYRENSPHFTAATAAKLLELLEKNGSDLWLYDVGYVGGLNKKTGENLRGFSIRAGLMAIGGLVNCGAIKQSRVKLSIQPLMVKGAHMGPCSVAAIED